MKYLRAIVIAGSFAMLPLAAGLFLFPPTARASENCAMTSADVAAVAAAETRGFAEELAARRVLLVRAIGCAKAEAQLLKDNLGSTPVGKDAEPLRSQLSEKLNGAMNYYDLELGKVQDAGVLGTQAIAREVRAWRAANYDPLAGQVANFALWAKNQTLFSVAKGRAGQMRNLVSFLEQVTPNQDLQTAIASGETLVQAASEENDAAKSALLQSLPPDESLTLITQSLQSLAGAYQKFFTVSTIVQALLSTTPSGEQPAK